MAWSIAVGRVVFLAVFVLLVATTAAFAQSPYVGASLFGDIVRTSHTETPSFDANPGSGEALGFTLRAGTPIGSNWGVELEYARPGRIKSDAQLVYPLLASPLPQAPADLLQLLAGAAPSIYPPINPIPLAIQTRDRHTTVSATVWALQNLSDRVAIVYLGGVAFNRFEREYEYGFTNAPASVGPGIFPLPSITSRTIDYSARPVVGLESWIGLTDHVTLTPGVRLQTVQDGWSVRPGVGIAWSF
jgi:hypothetical protein